MRKQVTIDGNLHTKLRLKAIHEGKTIQALAEELLAQAIN